MRIYQTDVTEWLVDCFGTTIAIDKTERCFRFTEESLELVQSLGISKDKVLEIVDYVYARPLGDPQQEVGGVMVTLTGLCTAFGISLEKAALTELLRCRSKTEQIRKKHFSKPKNVLSPLNLKR